MRARRETFSEQLDCALAERQATTDPEWRGASVQYAITLAYDYISPVDGRKHAGSDFVSRYPDDRKLRVGDAFSVMASKHDPEISTTALPAATKSVTVSF